MFCSICKEKPATVHLTQIVGDKMQKLDLCEDCAKAKGVNDPRLRDGGFHARPGRVAGNWSRRPAAWS
jgi:protein-arginine kinase activator protein McsA